MNPHKVKLNKERDSNYSDVSVNLLKNYYLKDNEKSPQEAFARTAENFCYGDYALAQRIYEYVSKGWASFASPVLSNSVYGVWKNGEFISHEKISAMPISCFLQFVADTLHGQIEAAKEIAKLSTSGGGIGSYLGMRGITEKSPGSIPYLKTMDSNIMYYHQAGTRRGSIAAYLDIDHPDIVEFIGVRNPTGGDINRKCLNTNIAVNITNKFLDAVKKDEPWELICPKTAEVTDTISSARDLWEEILETRFKTGEPYIHNVDESNNRLNPALKSKNLTISTSNLCLVGNTKITIADDCCGLKSMNISLDDFNEKFDMGYFDEVYVKSYNTETKENEFCLVTNSAMTGVVDELIKIVDGDFVIECTPEHKILTENRGYVMAQDILGTDRLVKLSADENMLKITKKKVKPTKVYDITVKKNNNFYANGVVVHNCSEIVLCTNEERTAVCCLSSLNVEHFDEWKDTTIVEDFVTFLDNVLQWFIDNAPDGLEKAVFSASHSRDLGLGMMGWHYYLMKHKIPFESGGFNSACSWSSIITKHIKDKAVKQSMRLAELRGEPEDLVGTGMRNAHLLSVAPNANSSIICNTSASIEPIKANIYSHRIRTGTHVIKNPYLEKLLREKLDYFRDVKQVIIGEPEEWIAEQWKLIMNDNGSIANIDYFTEDEKKLFRTANEIDMMYIIEQARIRQEYICQAQSLNLYFNEGVSRKYVNEVHMYAFSGHGSGVPLKTLYYCRASKSAKVENVSGKVVRNNLDSYSEQDESKKYEECIACSA